MSNEKLVGQFDLTLVRLPLSFFATASRSIDILTSFRISQLILITLASGITFGSISGSLNQLTVGVNKGPFGNLLALKMDSRLVSPCSCLFDWSFTMSNDLKVSNRAQVEVDVFELNRYTTTISTEWDGFATDECKMCVPKRSFDGFEDGFAVAAIFFFSFGILSSAVAVFLFLAIVFLNP